MNKPKDLTGQRSGKLIALRRAAGRGPWGHMLWRCKCDCGQTMVLTSNGFRSTQSCGCPRRTHGMSRTPTYATWSMMFQRCYNPANPRFHVYGGRGIKVCDRWRSFENFLADMGKKPRGKTIDRWPDPYGNYDPSNCRWATPKQQAQNWREAA